MRYIEKIREPEEEAGIRCYYGIWFKPAHPYPYTTMEVPRYNYVLLTQCRERDSRKIYTYWWEGYPPLKDGGTDLMEMLCCKEEFCLIWSAIGNYASIEETLKSAVVAMDVLIPGAATNLGSRCHAATITSLLRVSWVQVHHYGLIMERSQNQGR